MLKAAALRKAACHSKLVLAGSTVFLERDDPSLTYPYREMESLYSTKPLKKI